jgi:hypothetical protein
MSSQESKVTCDFKVIELFVAVLKIVFKVTNHQATNYFVPQVPRFMFPDGKCQFYVKDTLRGKVASSK